MPTATPAQQDRFYIKVLLAKVKRATSFKKLRTYKNTTNATIQAACLALGLDLFKTT